MRIGGLRRRKKFRAARAWTGLRSTSGITTAKSDILTTDDFKFGMVRYKKLIETFFKVYVRYVLMNKIKGCISVTLIIKLVSFQ